MPDRSYRDVEPITDLVTNEEMYEAMVYLDTVAHDYAEAYAQQDYCANMVKQMEAVGALFSDETSNDRRLWDARNRPAYGEAVRNLRDAQVAWKTIEAKRQAAILKIDIWRTVHADKRAREVAEPGRR